MSLWNSSIATRPQTSILIVGISLRIFLPEGIGEWLYFLNPWRCIYIALVWHEQVWRILFCWRQFRLWPFWLTIMDGECLFFTFFAVQLPGIWSSLLTEVGDFLCFFLFVNLFPNCTTAYLLNSSHFEIYAVYLSL